MKRKTSLLAGALAFLAIIAACAWLCTEVFHLGDSGSRPGAGSLRHATGGSTEQAAVDKPSARPAAKSPAAASVGSDPKSSGNKAHDLLAGQPDAQRNQTLTVFMKQSKEDCDSIERSFFQGFDESRSAFWNVACRNGRTFAVMVYNDASGSTKVLDCDVLKVVAGVECFKKF